MTENPAPVRVFPAHDFTRRRWREGEWFARQNTGRRVVISISHIVCPVDFSECSRQALGYAESFAEWYGSRLSIVHVFPPVAVPDLPVSIEESAAHERAFGELQRFVASLNGARPVELRALAGSALAKTIVTDATETRADLMVLGSHGRSGLERALLGSVSEHVVRHAPCPVLVVPRRIADDPAGPSDLRRVLCAVDFSEASLKALEYAMAIAEESDADLTLLHVYAFPPDLLPASPAGVEAPAGLLEPMDAARRQLEDLIPSELRAYCVVDTMVRAGAVHHEILAAASSLRSDLIVMGVHGRGALNVMVFGSNTARVVRAATCPVLVVRRH
jgi:nucleotide-binding universal stress UspA family protein